MTRNFAIRGATIRRRCLVCGDKRGAAQCLSEVIALHAQTCNTVYVDTSRCNLDPNQQNLSLWSPLYRKGRNTEDLLNIREKGDNEEEYCCVCKVRKRVDRWLRRYQCAHAQKQTLHANPSTLCHGPYVILTMNSPWVDQRNSVTMRSFVHKGETWTLIAVVVHRGSNANGGHYVAYCEIPGTHFKSSCIPPNDLPPADPNHWRLLNDEIVTNIGLPDLDGILTPGEDHRVLMAVYRVDKLYQQHQTTEEQPPPAAAERPLPPPTTAEKPSPPPRFAFGTSTGESGASMVQRLMQKRGPGAGFEVAAEPKQVKPVVIVAEDEVGIGGGW